MEKSSIDKTELEEVVEHQAMSERYLEPSRNRYLDYESMVLSEHRESEQNENTDFDTRVSTIELEHTAQVADKRPMETACARSTSVICNNLLITGLTTNQNTNATAH